MPPQRLDRAPPPRYAYAMRAYNNSLRSVVITLSLITAIWTLIWAIDMFNQMNVDHDHSQPKLATFALVIGILYISTTAICIFGIVAAALQREKPARVFALASIVGAVCICGAGFVRVVTHFTLKDDLINECTNVVTGSDVTFRFGIWGPRVHDHLDAAEAAQFCKDAWSHDSASEVISLIVELFLSAFFVFVAYGYTKQLHQSKSDRSHAILSTTHDFDDSDPATAAGYPMHYNPPYLAYDSPAPNAGAAPAYAPPAGPPPGVVGSGKKDMDDPFADFESVKKRSKESLV